MSCLFIPHTPRAAAAAAAVVSRPPPYPLHPPNPVPSRGQKNNGAARARARPARRPSQTASRQGRPFYRIIEGFIDQAGADVGSALPGGGQFRDDPGGLRLRHDRAGLLSMANGGPDTNTAHFSVMIGPAP